MTSVIVSLPQEALRRRRSRRRWELALYYGSCLLIGLALGWALGARL